MLRLLLSILLLAAAGDGGPFDDDDARRKGRGGNDLYMQEKYNEAADAYVAGLLALEGTPASTMRYGLHNNLGSALLRSGNAGAALEAFDEALAFAVDPADIARSAYNAGNGAFAGEDLERALDYYRESLLADPENADAKFNYEFVKRQLEEQEQQQQQQDGEQDQQDEQNEQSENGEGDRNEQEQPNDQQQDEQEQQPQESQPTDPRDRLDRRQAEQILEALQNEEEQLLRQVQRPKTRPRQVEKDW